MTHSRSTEWDLLGVGEGKTHTETETVCFIVLHRHLIAIRCAIEGPAEAGYCGHGIDQPGHRRGDRQITASQRYRYSNQEVGQRFLSIPVVLPVQGTLPPSAHLPFHHLGEARDALGRVERAVDSFKKPGDGTGAHPAGAQGEDGFRDFQGGAVPVREDLGGNPLPARGGHA